MSTTLSDIVHDALRKHYLETENDPNDEHARIFAADLFRRAYRWNVEDIAERAGRQSYLPENDSPYRSPLQEKVRAAVASGIRWWWNDDLAEMRADAGGRAVADLIDEWSVHYALEAAKRGPQPKAAMPPEVEAAYEAEQRYNESRRRW
jgi:hypothetical protein